jgi:acyl-CoA thioester hydrolase
MSSPAADAPSTLLADPGGWDLPDPHVISLTVAERDLDAYRHVNNAVYMTWFDEVAWSHSAALGLPLARCLELDRGMAVLRSVISYLKPARADEALLVATWILAREGLRVSRRFQVLRPGDSTTLVRAEIEYACIELSSGRPTRWPPPFVQCYRPIDSVVERHPLLAPL